MAASPLLDSSSLDSSRNHSRPPRHSAIDPWAGMVAASLGIQTAQLTEFSQKMESHGIAIDASRLFFDPVYAYKRLALAHATDDEALKTLTVEMFERYKALERRRRSVSAFSRPH